MTMKRILVAVAIVAVLSFQAESALAQGELPDSTIQAGATSQAKKSSDLTGSWLVTATPPGGAPSFQGLMTFDPGGGFVASAQGDILLIPPPGVPPIATAGHGAWVKTGPREFLMTFRQIFYEADGSFQGGAKIRQAVTLSQTGNEWSGRLTVEFFDAAGNVIFSGEGSGQAERIKPEPLAP
jgi:hypothetical protein